jgi:hypothetical protein
LGVVLILRHRARAPSRLGRRSTPQDAFGLGVGALGIASGFELLVISVATLLLKRPSVPFGQWDLGFIAISGVVLMVVCYDAIEEIFNS